MRGTIAFSLLGMICAAALTGCGNLIQQMIPEYDTEKSALLDDALVLFIGEPDDRDMPTTLDSFGDNVLLALRSKPEAVEGMAAFEHHVQLRTVEGELIWDHQVRDGWRCVDVLNFHDEAVFALVEQRDTEEKLEEVWLLQLSGDDGHMISEANLVHWNMDYFAHEMFWLPNDLILVQGRQRTTEDQPMKSFDLVVNRAGKWEANWNADPSLLLPIEDGFLGAAMIPGMNPYPEVTIIGLDGIPQWTISRADSVIGGQLYDVASTGDGDLIAVFWDHQEYRGIVARLAGTNGSIRWIKRLDTGFLTRLYDVLPWDKNQYLLCGQKSFSSAKVNAPFWESICCLVIDGDGNLVDDDALINFWSMPYRGGFDVAGDRILFSGIGGKDLDEAKPQWDVAWIVLDRPALTDGVE